MPKEDGTARPLDEELRPLLRRIIESFAWRQIASMNILGHCLKFVLDLETKLRVANELDLALRLFHEVAGLYAELGWEEIETVVRDRVEDIPYPCSRIEFGVAYFLTGLAERVAMQAFVECRVSAFADIAAGYVNASSGRPAPTRFIEFCEQARNRPQAQLYTDRWLPIALVSLGRPGSEFDQRSVDLGLRSRSSAQLQADFMALVRPFLDRCGLALSDLAAAGIELAPSSEA